MNCDYYKLNKDLYLYKNRTLRFINSTDVNKNKFKNHLIIYPTFNINCINTIIKSNIFDISNIRGYYYPRIEKFFSCKNKKITNNQKIVYDDINKKYPSFVYTRRNLSLYNNFNVIYDLSEYYKLFKSTYKAKKTFNSVVNDYIHFFNEVLDKLTNSGYDHKVLFFIPEKMITTGKEISFENLLYYVLKNNITDINMDLLKQYEIIFSDKLNSRMFKFSLKNFDNDNNQFDINKYRRLSNILYKLSNGIKLEDDEENEINNSVSKEEVLSTKTSKITEKNKDIKVNNNEIKRKLDAKLNTNIKHMTKDELDLYSNVTNKIDEAYEDNDTEEEANLQLSTDEDFKSDLEDLSKMIENTGVSEKKINYLKSKQQEAKFSTDNDMEEDLMIEEIVENMDIDLLDKEVYKTNVLNEEVKTSTLKELDKSYINHQQKKDFIKTFSAFNEDKDCPLYVTDIQVEDTSTSSDKKETYTVKLEDGWGNKHTIKIDIPIVIDYSFMYLNDGKKAIPKQLTPLPIIKIKNDTVVIATNYKKMYLWRFGNKVHSNIDKLKKFLQKESANYKKDINVVFANNIGTNSKYLSTLEYDELSQTIIKLDIGNDKFIFNREDVNEVVSDEMNIIIENFLPEHEFLLGYNKSTNGFYVINNLNGLVYSYNRDHNERTHYNSIYDLLLELFKNKNNDIYETLIKEKTSKKYMYSRTRIIAEHIPTIILLGYYSGLENIMQRYKIKYEFVEKKKKLSNEEINNYSVIQFKDGFLYYEHNPLRNSLLMNGLMEIKFLKEIEFSKMNTVEPYLEFFQVQYNSRNKGKGFKNFLDLLLDPKSKEVLNRLKLPTNLIDLILYGNTLLEDNSFTNINDTNNYRVRGMEQINAYLYNVFAEAFRTYKDKHKSGGKEKIQIQQDKLIKEILSSNICDAYSTLSPILEVDKLSAITYKGIGGSNLDSAFTPQMRSFDKSMTGLLGMSTPDSNKVGVTRQLSYNCKITDTLGTIDNSKSVNEFDATNLFTPAELINGYTSLHADPPRIGMQTQQAKHSVPTKRQSRPLYGSGIEKTLPNLLGSDFINVAEQDGKIKLVDEKNELAIIEFKDGTTDVIDLESKQYNNSNGGLINRGHIKSL